MAGTTSWVKGWGKGTQTAKLSVGFAFGSAPFASTASKHTDRTWYSASTMTRHAQITLGRTHDLDQFGPATCDLIVDNRSRLMDPSCSTNTHAGKVIPGTPVWVRMRKYDNATNTLFTGFVESWEVRYPEGRDSYVKVRCVDGLKYLALSDMTTQTTGTRSDTMIHRILTAADWPSSSGGSTVGATTGWRYLAEGLSSGQNYQGNGVSALEMCRNVAESEGGFFLMDHHGRARFYSRNWYVSTVGAATAAVFGDDQGNSSELPYTDLRLGCDDYQLYNHVSIGRRDGGTVSTWSTESIDLYGKRVLRKNNLLSLASTDAKVTARWLVNRYKSPGVRVDRITCKPRSDTGLFDLMDIGTADTGGARIGAKVRVMRRPPGGGTISKVCRVEGFTHDIDVGNNDWTVTYNLSPSTAFPAV